MRFRPLRVVALLFPLGLLSLAGVSWRVGSRLVAPTNHPVPLPPGLPAEVVSIPGSAHDVAGWWLDRGAGSPVVLLLHAIRADRRSMVPRARVLLDEGFSVLLIDLQAHGETPGRAITLGWRESADVHEALEWLRRRRPSSRVGVDGCSLGGAAVLLGPQPSGFDAVVLEAVYPRVADAVEDRIRLQLGPLAPLVAPLLLAQLGPRLHLSAHDLEPIRHIAQLGAPVLVVAGALDEHTTLRESEDLFSSARAPKELWVVAGARHQDFLAFDPEGYRAHVVRFLLQYLRPAA